VPRLIDPREGTPNECVHSNAIGRNYAQTRHDRAGVIVVSRNRIHGHAEDSRNLAPTMSGSVRTVERKFVQFRAGVFVFEHAVFLAVHKFGKKA
jgi:hypothetical protein